MAAPSPRREPATCAAGPIASGHRCRAAPSSPTRSRTSRAVRAAASTCRPTRCAGSRWLCPSQTTRRPISSMAFAPGSSTATRRRRPAWQPTSWWPTVPCSGVLSSTAMARCCWYRKPARLAITTEMGRLDVGPGEIALLPRGIAFSVALPDGQARAYVCENYGAPFRLPELGPIGSNGLANPRDFVLPRSGFRRRCRRVAGGQEIRRHTVAGPPCRLAVQCGRLAWQPGALHVRHENLHGHRLDQPRPPRPVDLHRAHLAERDAGHGQLRFRDLPAALAGRRRHVSPTLVPPQRDERIHGIGLRHLRRQGEKASCPAAPACTTQACRTAPTPMPSRRRAGPSCSRSSSRAPWPLCSRAAGRSGRPSSRCAAAAACSTITPRSGRA